MVSKEDKKETPKEEPVVDTRPSFSGLLEYPSTFDVNNDFSNPFTKKEKEQLKELGEKILEKGNPLNVTLEDKQRYQSCVETLSYLEEVYDKKNNPVIPHNILTSNKFYKYVRLEEMLGKVIRNWLLFMIVI